MVLEVKLHVDGLGVGLVAEEGNEHFEGVGENLGVVVLQDTVDALDGVLGDEGLQTAAGSLESVTDRRLGALLLELNLLVLISSSQLLDTSLLGSSGLTAGLELSLVGCLLLLLSADLFGNASSDGLGSVPVSGLELGDGVEGALALVSLLADELEELGLAKALESVADVLFGACSDVC